ncbi:MAG: acyl-CoA dehydrogenase [Alphaproteobacteria bacterium]
MTGYAAPLRDMRFVLRDVVGLEALARLPGFEEVTPDLVDEVLAGAGRLAAEVLAPLNQPGDRQGSRLENGLVKMPTGFPEAYRRFVEGGWPALRFHPAIGGHGLPRAVATAACETWLSANVSFTLCHLLTEAAVELLAAHGSDSQKALFLPKLAAGEWTATMCMTEPQAGSDVGALTTRAVKEGDHYRLTGTKIFTTYGDHDLAPNIVHLVLARTPEAPPGIKGVSLFIVPKRLVGDDGRPGARNDVRPVSLEHKLGINASPTAVMAFGDEGGAVGELVGEDNRGIEYMFTMMNSARLSVGLQGVALAERAFQQAVSYARERRQGHRLGREAEGPVPLVEHADVRRMLLTMKALAEATRALAYDVAGRLDVAKRHRDLEVRRQAWQRVELLTPVIKAFGTDAGVEAASLGIQVHGGVGYIEETGAAQHLRDARVGSIYEGTNGIQALDLLRRKVARDEGTAARAFLDEVRALDTPLAEGNDEDLASVRRRLKDAADALDKATRWMTGTFPRDPDAAAAGASDYLRTFGLVACGEAMARAALAARRRLAAGNEDACFLRDKLATAGFFAERLLPQASALLISATRGSPSRDALEAERG